MEAASGSMRSSNLEIAGMSVALETSVTVGETTSQTLSANTARRSRDNIRSRKNELDGLGHELYSNNSLSKVPCALMSLSRKSCRMLLSNCEGRRWRVDVYR